MSSKRTIDKHVKALCSHWDDEAFHEALERVMNMYDVLLEARAELDDDGIEEICRAMYFRPDNFNRFIRMAELQRENEKSTEFPIFVKPQSLISGADCFGGQVGAALGQRLRILLVKHIGAFDGGLPIHRQHSFSSQFNYGVRITGIHEIGFRVLRITFELGAELRDACGVSVSPAPTAHVYFEVWASDMIEFRMNGEQAEKYLSQTHLDVGLTNQCNSSSDDEGVLFLAKVDRAMTAITLCSIRTS